MIEATNPHYTSLPLAQVEPSLTNPRKHFDAARLQELADSIMASGIHQPILVRPLPAQRVADTAFERNSLKPRATRPTHEIVAGERRYRAAKLAGLAQVPVIVKHMTDDQVLEAQILENLQREDLTELEEAEGYQTLMDHSQLTAEQVAAKVGKSRTYIYGRLKLLDLATEGREALRTGQIEASVALLVARIPDTAVQAKALKAILDQDHYQGQRVSARSAADLIRRQFMLSLDSAPFDIKADALTAAGACTACPKRTGANPDLFAEVKGADLCTDPTCHAAKVQAHRTATMAQAHQRGLTVIEGREAKAIMPNAWQNHLDGYLRLDNPADSPTGQPLRKVLAKAMAHSGVKETLLANPHREGELVAVLPTATVSDLLSLAAQLDTKAAPAAAAMAEKTEAQRKVERAALAGKRINEFESAWRWAVLEEVWAEAKSAAESTPASTPSHHGMPDDLARHIAQRMGNTLNQDRAKRLGKLLGLDKVAPCDALRDNIAIHPHPTALLWLLVAEADVEHRHWLPEREANTGLLLAAQAFEVNIDTVQKAVKAELREKHAAEDQKALLPLTPAAQASGVRGEDKAKAKPKGKKAPAAQAAPTLSAEDAAQGIAAAMQSLEEEGQAHPSGAPGEPDGSYQRPAADGIDAAPIAAPAQPQPVQATTPAPDVTPATHGQASPATGLAVGVRVLVLDTASGVKQAARVGQQGHIDRQVGPEAWDVRFEGKLRKVPQWVCFHASELEVVA